MQADLYFSHNMAHVEGATTVQTVYASVLLSIMTPDMAERLHAVNEYIQTKIVETGFDSATMLFLVFLSGFDDC